MVIKNVQTALLQANFLCGMFVYCYMTTDDMHEINDFTWMGRGAIMRCLTVAKGYRHTEGSDFNIDRQSV